MAVVGRDGQAGEACLAEFGASEAAPIFLQADICERQGMDRVAEAVEERFGGLDVLCCNAGMFPQANLATMAEGDWDSIFAINLKGMLFSIQSCLPLLKRSQAGRIVLTSPGVPPERVTALRRAFDTMVRDPELIGELQKAAMDVLPLTGERLTEQIGRAHV